MATNDADSLTSALATSDEPPGPWAALLARLPPQAQSPLVDALVRGGQGAMTGHARARLLQCWLKPALVEPGSAVWAALVERPLFQRAWSLEVEMLSVHTLAHADARKPRTPTRVRAALEHTLRTWGDRHWVRHSAWSQQLLVAQRTILLTARLTTGEFDGPGGPLTLLLTGIEVYLHSTVPTTRYLGMVTAQTLTTFMRSGGARLDFGLEASPAFLALDPSVRAELARLATLAVASKEPDIAADRPTSAAADGTVTIETVAAAAPAANGAVVDTAPTARARTAAANPDASDPDADLVAYAMDDDDTLEGRGPLPTAASGAPSNSAGSTDDDVGTKRKPLPRLAYVYRRWPQLAVREPCACTHTG